MMINQKLPVGRRRFVKSMLASGVGLAVAPTIMPRSLFGAHAPCNQIQIGAIGVYIYKIETMKHQEMKKLVVIR